MTPKAQPHGGIGPTCVTLPAQDRALARAALAVPEDWCARSLLAADFNSERTRTAAAIDDVCDGLLAWRFWTMLGWTDIKQRYQRSKIGPLWISISMALMVGGLALIYGSIFKLALSDYVLYLAAGMITWLFVSTSVLEGTTAFIIAEGIIKQSAIPLSIYIYRLIWRGLIVMLHNAAVLLVIFPLLRPISALNPVALLAGLLLVMANLFVVTLVLATLCTRFRDLPPIVTSLMQVTFYVTPILYEPSQLPEQLRLIAHYNPLYHLIDVLRRPLIGELPDAISYVVALGTFAIVGSFAFLFFRRYRGRVAYWL
jgi:ABC-type polysaccharide/polyol phosphate export permease